jgi:limonene-1,2-epoxide hydrolase
VRLRPAFCLLVAAFVLIVAGLSAGCGDEANDPTSIVERWSKAINASDDKAAANLFADNATVIQGGQSVTLTGHDEALAFNASLPCGGKIVEQALEGDEVTATFTLIGRPGHTCDGPGQTAVAVFRITDGKIVVWQQLPAPDPATQSA